MLNYLRGEQYKLLHRKYTLIFTLIIMACEALLVSGWIFTNSRGNSIDFCDGGVIAASFLSLGLFLLIVIADVIFSSQYKNNTLKNEVSFGIPRSRIFLGKYLTAAAAGVLLSLFFLVFYLALCRLTLLPSTAEDSVYCLTIVGWCALASLPQYLGMLALCMLLMFQIRSEIAAVAAYIGILAVPSYAFKLAFVFSSNSLWATLSSLMPTNMIDYASSYVGDWSYMGSCWAMGAAWLAVSLILGLLLFQKKEIS